MTVRVRTRRKPPASRRLPDHFVEFGATYPQVFEAYARLGAAAMNAGPLDAKTTTLVKLALAVGARQEGAVHSHARRARAAGWSADELRHAVLLGVTTLGFPAMMAAQSWISDVVGRPRQRLRQRTAPRKGRR